MLITRSFFLLVVFVLLSGSLIAQQGVIRGTVYDDETAEPLPGVTILLEGTTTGTMTDFDGKFSLNVPAGNHQLRVSFISFETLSISDVSVKDGEVVLFDNLRLRSADFQLDEVVVSAEMIRRTEEALLMVKKQSANLIDGISSANFRKIGDSDAAASMKRVPGISVEGGKYIYVRGLGDRYTKATLNGMDIPGLDPDRNTLQMDIFPTNIIDNIIVVKSFTADLPADFTGGVIDISTKDFPEVRTGSISISGGYNPQMHFNSNYLTYAGGKTDWLGFDDGTRLIPATEDIPFFTEVIGNPNGERAERYKEILRSFNPNLSSFEQQSLMDYSLGISFGDQFSLIKDFSIGYNFSFTYRNETSFYKEAQFGNYGLLANPDEYEMELRESAIGDYGENNVLLGGLAGIAIKSKKSKIRINYLQLQNGESRAGKFDFIGADQGSEFFAFQQNLDYSERSIKNIFVNGKHFFPVAKFEIDWRLSQTASTMDDPDVRFTRYEKRAEEFAIGTETGFPERIWRELSEVNQSAQLNLSKDFSLLNRKAKLQAGAAYTYKERDYIIRTFTLNIRNVPLTGDMNELLFEENLWPLGGSISRGTTFEAPFIPDNPNQFNASNRTSSAYVSLHFLPHQKIRSIIGLRIEDYKQFYTGQNQLGTIVYDNEAVLDQLDFFPTINLIYSVNDQQNIRFSFAKTIARPSFKEMSFAEIYDPLSSRTFVGGLFRDANDIAGIEFWDGNLRTSNISNFDLRWERFMEHGQTFSISAFYKSFENPIELVQFLTQKGAFQPRNVGDGFVVGSEIEFRKNLGFLGVSLINWNISGNFTYTISQIELSATEFESRKGAARAGQVVNTHRDMAGQAPYIVNAGVAYQGDKGFWQNLEAGLYYNVQGKTLLVVGIADRPDVYSLPFHSLTFNANKKFGKNNKMSFGFKVDNVLGSTKETVFLSYKATDQYYNFLNPGRKFSLRFSYNIF